MHARRLDTAGEHECREEHRGVAADALQCATGTAAPPSWRARRRPCRRPGS
jgi:hypothetical protein